MGVAYETGLVCGYDILSLWQRIRGCDVCPYVYHLAPFLWVFAAVILPHVLEFSVLLSEPVFDFMHL